jgi:hypothetical protein
MFGNKEQTFLDSKKGKKWPTHIFILIVEIPELKLKNQFDQDMSKLIF